METKNKFIYIFIIAVMSAFVFFFSKPYLLYALFLILLLAVFLAIFIKADAEKLSVSLRAGSGGQPNMQLPVSIVITKNGNLISAGYIFLDIEIENVLFGTTESISYRIPIGNSREESFHTSILPAQCGQLIFRCKSAHITDVLDLFSCRASGFSETRTTIYPHDVNVELNVSHNTVGIVQTEEFIQNRRGSDPSEVFDFKEYTPGDDIRSIHWKLSVKTDRLLLREPSDPMHYDVVLMPDIGLYGSGGEASSDELNTAAALCTSIGEQLLKQNVTLCMAIPSADGLEIAEADNLRVFYSLLPQWLSMPVCKQSGMGLHLFIADHLDHYFTRMIIVSAGKYDHELSPLQNKIGITIVSAVDTDKPVYAHIGAVCNIAEIPSKPKHGDSFRIIC